VTRPPTKPPPRRAGTRGGGGKRAPTRGGGRATSKAERARPDSIVEVDDEQLVAEDDVDVEVEVDLADVADAEASDAHPIAPASGTKAGSVAALAATATGPTTRIALHEQTLAQLQMVRMVVDAFRHTVVAAGAGAEGVARVLAAMREEEPPGVVVTAIPGGEAICDAATKLEPRRPIVVVTGAGGMHQLAERAERLGAEMFAVRPHEPDRLGPVVAAAARLAAEREELVAIRGAHSVLRQKVDEQADGDTTGVLGFEAFQRTLELELKRARRFNYPLSVAVLELTAGELPSGGSRILRARTTAAIVETVRDIDLITELDDGRYLVLLPYTDGGGAQQVALRLIQAVADLPPITIGGASARGSLRVGVAGAQLGQPVSFARLMKDANSALAKARDLGIDLAVNAS
jgi:hypothetical protein